MYRNCHHCAVFCYANKRRLVHAPVHIAAHAGYMFSSRCKLQFIYYAKFTFHTIHLHFIWEISTIRRHKWYDSFISITIGNGPQGKPNVFRPVKKRIIRFVWMKTYVILDEYYVYHPPSVINSKHLQFVQF